MNPPNVPGLDRAARILEEANRGVPTNEDVAKIIADVLREIVSLGKSLQNRIADGDKAAIAAAVSRFTSSPTYKALARAANTDLPKRIDDVSRGTSDKIANLSKSLDELQAQDLDGRLFSLETAEKVELPDADTPQELRAKLESLEGPEKLAISAIFNLQETLDELRRQIGNRGMGHTFAIQRGQIKLYDLSDQLDGSKATFALPAFWRVLDVKSTSAPNAYRPGVDYNVDANLMTITFTNQIDPASTLAQGQTLLVEYAEP